MNTTTRHTEYLVTEHNCVVLEGLGAVLVSRCNARLHPDGSITPPHATYAFNSEVVHTDGILENSIARAEGISYERAAAVVRTDVEAMKHQLDHEGRVSLGRIGTIVRNDDDHTVRLETFDADLLSPLASWLPPVPAIETLSSGDNPEVDRTVRRTPRLRKFVRAAVAAAAVICVAIVSSTPITVKDAHYASTALPEVSGPKEAFIPREASTVLNISLPVAEEGISIDADARQAWQESMKSAEVAAENEEATIAAAPVSEKMPLRLNAADAYCVVVASLTTEADAIEFVDTQKRRNNLHFGITESDGRWRVYAATASTVAGAKNAAEELSAYGNAWVCRLN